MFSWIDSIIHETENNQISSSQVHLYGLLLYIILLLIYSYFLIRIRENFISAGHWNQGYFAKSFFLSIVGIYMLIFNFFLTKLVLYLTNGQFSIFYQEKGIFAEFGFTCFFIFFPYCGLTIISISPTAKKVTKILLVLISAIIVFSFILSILALFDLITFQLKIFMGLLSFLLCTTLLFSIFFLTREIQTSFSKINKVRIKILITGLLFILFDVISIMLGFFIQIYFADVFHIWNNVLQPIERFIFYSISISCLYLSFFFPLWLQEKTGVLPPSFAKIIEKRRPFTTS
jgi:hypothetical protein